MHVLRNFRVFKGPEWSITDQQADSAADHITPTSDSSQSSSHRSLYRKKVKVALTRLLSVGSRSWSRFLVVSQVSVSHKPGDRLQLLSARPAVTLATLKRAGTYFAAWRTKARWVWTVCLWLIPTASRLRFKPRSHCAWVQHANGSNGILSPGLWLTSPAGWLPRTGISSGTLRSVIEYGLSLLYSD